MIRSELDGAAAGSLCHQRIPVAELVGGQRMVAAPFPDVRVPVIDPADIAEVASVLLTKDEHGEHGEHVHELTGPQPLSPREQARILGEALESPIRFVEQSHTEAKAQLGQFMPEPIVDATLAILGQPTAAEARVSPAVGQLLGRAPRTFADWVARNIAAFR